MPDILIVFIGMAVGVFIGAQLALLVLETRHDCLPHDPRRCAVTAKLPEGTHR